LYYVYLHAKGEKKKAEELKRKYKNLISINKKLLNKKTPSSSSFGSLQEICKKYF